MKHANTRVFVKLSATLLSIILIAGCATGSTKNATSVVDYLYPTTKDPVVKPGIPVLTLPLRVGIAFVPSEVVTKGRWNHINGSTTNSAITEYNKNELMKEVADHFKKYAYVKEIEIIPSAYLRPGGSFTNLDQIRTMYGVDVIALLSYDQVQFTDEGMLSLTYWTIVGAYIVPGEKNDTHTMLDAVVYDIKSRKMLFRAPGTSRIKGTATLINLSEEARIDSNNGFTEASKEMILNLDEQLSTFKEKVKERPKEYKVIQTSEYSDATTSRSGGVRMGGGSIDLFPLLLLAGLGGYFLWMQKRK